MNTRTVVVVRHSIAVGRPLDDVSQDKLRLLTTRGIELAHVRRKLLVEQGLSQFSLVIHSDARRAAATARILSGGEGVSVSLPELHEMKCVEDEEIMLRFLKRVGRVPVSLFANHATTREMRVLCEYASRVWKSISEEISRHNSALTLVVGHAQYIQTALNGGYMIGRSSGLINDQSWGYCEGVVLTLNSNRIEHVERLLPFPS